MQKNQSANKGQPSREGKPLVYLVDDEPLVLELAAALLRPLNCQVESFRDAESALAAYSIADPLPDLIITDYAMHRMNGLEFIHACRRLHPRQKIILTSGTVDEDIYRHSSVRPDQFLAKPYRAREFMEMVAAALPTSGGAK